MSMTDTIVASRVDEVKEMLRQGPQTIDAAEKLLNDSKEARKQELDKLSDEIKKSIAIIEHLEKRKQEAERRKTQAENARTIAWMRQRNAKTGSKEAEVASEEVARCEKAYEEAVKMCDLIQKRHDKEVEFRKRLEEVVRLVQTDLNRLNTEGEGAIREARSRYPELTLQAQYNKLREKESL